MNLCNCIFKSRCTTSAILAGILIGVISAFLQITGTAIITPAFLLGSLVLAVLFLALLLLSVSLAPKTSIRECLCDVLTILLAGILGTVLLALILIASGITATSVISAILVGILLFFLTLIFTGAACFIRCIIFCTD